MEIRVEPRIQSKIKEALRKAGRREIGGILMGECLAPNHFRVSDLSTSARRGSFSNFIRSLVDALEPLRNFFVRTGYQYKRFNYLGEWHSHPSFVPVPSASDIQTMLEIVRDPQVGATFAVLLIVRLDSDRLKGSATVFPASGAAFRACLIWETE